MDVAAYDAITAATARFFRHHLFEIANEAHGILGLVLQVLRHRPIRQVELQADRVQPAIELEQHGVDRIAEVGEPACVVHDTVEQIAVRDPQALAVCGHVDGIFGDNDLAQREADELADEFIVVARDVDNPRPLTSFAQQLLHDVVVLLGPVPPLAQLPAIQNIADQIQRFGLVAAQKIEQIIGLAARRAEMNI